MFVIKWQYSENCYRVTSTRVRCTASPGPTAISFADTIVCRETAIVILVELCHVTIHYIPVALSCYDTSHNHVTTRYISHACTSHFNRHITRTPHLNDHAIAPTQNFAANWRNLINPMNTTRHYRCHPTFARVHFCRRYYQQSDHHEMTNTWKLAIYGHQFRCDKQSLDKH
jgi:hypothetical protein